MSEHGASEDSGRECLLDARLLEPPEPMTRVLGALETLQAGQYVRMLHRMEPVPLYPILRQDGFRHHTRFGEIGAFEIFIWRRGDAGAEQAVEAMLQSG